MNATTYTLRYSAQAREMLQAITDRRARSTIIRRARKLREDPEKQGKPLVDDLSGFWSVRAVGQRYRILYEIRRTEVLVLVVAVGLRKQGGKKDVYELAKKLIRQGLLDPPE